LLRELAGQGIDVLLVDKSDFCGGTSAAMTRVIHGGLRYLENAEVRRCASPSGTEPAPRKHAPLCQTTAHHDSNLQLDVRVGSAIWNLLGWPTKPANRGALLIKTGLTLYEFPAGRDPRFRDTVSAPDERLSRCGPL